MSKCNPCFNGICSLTNNGRCLRFKSGGLNPCSNGICSLTGKRTLLNVSSDSLNPCSNGICSLTNIWNAMQTDIIVLILVLMEYAL